MRAGKIICASVLLLALGFSLAACGRLPKPFHRSDAPPDALVRAKGGQGVRVTLVEGATEPMAKLIAASVAKALQAYDIPATIGPGGKLRYALRGRVLSGGGATSATPTRIEWRLTDRNDEPFFSFNHDVEGSAWEWEWGSPKIIEEIGYQAGRLVADAIAPEDHTLVPQTAALNGVWVQPIEGAPGDGDTSLTRAMRFALMGANVAVTSERGAARHILQGKVALGKVQGKSQPVEIRWTVVYPDGGTVGSAVQRNAVPPGTFDGRWGETAAIIAAAAVPGVKDVLDRAEETVRMRISGDGQQLQTDIPLETEQPVLPPPELSPEPDLPSAQPPAAPDKQ